MNDLNFLKNMKIAHRGVYDNERIYENTTQAFTRALKFNFVIELDVTLLECGTLVIFHDDDLNRLFHVDTKISNITYDELSYIAKYKIPTLENVLELINGKVPLLIELKGNFKKHILENKIIDILDNYDGLFAIQSFNMRHVKYIKKQRKNYSVGYIIGKNNAFKQHLYKNYDFLNINSFLFKDKKIRKLRENKLVLGYNIKNKQEYSLKKDVFDNLVLDNILEIIN